MNNSSNTKMITADSGPNSTASLMLIHPKFKTKRQVCVYKEYYDADAYGEEIIKVFDSYRKAIDYMHARVKEFYGIDNLIPWENVLKTMFPTEKDMKWFKESLDTFTEDYVSMSAAKGTRFWIVEPIDVE